MACYGKAQRGRRLPLRTCKHCGKEFRPREMIFNTFCSRECAFAYRKAHAKKHQPKPSKPNVVCVICGKAITGTTRTKYCSDQCRKERDRQHRRETFVSVRETNPYIEKVCAFCGKTYRTNFRVEQSMYCSERCARRAAKVRDGKPPCSIEYVFERDGGICQICGRKLSLRDKYDDDGGAPPTPFAPTRDHRVPLSWGGPNTKENIQLACYTCNCIHKRAQRPVQLRMLEWGTSAKVAPAPQVRYLPL